MWRLWVFGLALGVTGQVAQAQNTEESATLPSDCLGQPRAVPLEAHDPGFLDLNGAAKAIAFGDALRVCIFEDSVAVFGTVAGRLPCAEIRDSPDEGIGHGFEAGGVPHHLWFHIEPGRNVLEVGLYREDAQLVWIDTGLGMCGG